MTRSKPLSRASFTIATVLVCASLAAAQTKIVPPKNKYTVAEDVKLGREAAAEAERQLPLLRDDGVSSYVEGIGRRLVESIPSELQQREFRYTFRVVNLREINAFALPGGPMYLHRGMIEAARNEGEVAGVMAHELSHVVLRHGTAQASKATKYEIGATAGAILGAIIGGGWGQVISQGTQFGLGTAFMRFGREFERQADIQGAQIMARAGYDPRDMASMFKTIEQQGGAGGPAWLSSHPNPGDRFTAITREAQLLRVDNPIRETRAFSDVKAQLKRLPPAPSSEEVARSNGRTGGTGTTGRTRPAPTGRVAAPSSRLKTYTEGNLFRVSVPANWRELPAGNTVTFAPDGGYGDYNGQSVFTHGIEFGIARNETHDLETATEELVASLARSNAELDRPSRYTRISIDGRPGISGVMSNRSEVTGQGESIELFATQMRDGTLFYAVGVAPRDAFFNYQDVFQRIIRSVRLMDDRNY